MRDDARCILLIFGALLIAQSNAASATNSGLSPARVPRYLVGLWALGHKCNEKGKQLRITAHTMQFGSKAPVKFDYYPPANPPGIEWLVPKGREHAWSYVKGDGVLFEYRVSKSEDEMYFRCPVHPVAGK